MTSVYLDVCCLNRPFDDQLQDRIRLESEAVLQILMHVQFGDWEWISSQVVEWEIEQTTDVDRRLQVKLLASHAGRLVNVGDAEIGRATELEALGFRALEHMMHYILHARKVQRSTYSCRQTTSFCV